MKKEHLISNKETSPEYFIRTQAKSLALGPCYINKLWKELGSAIIIVSRRHANDNLSFAFYYIDLYCKGLIKTTWAFNLPEKELDQEKVLVEQISFGVDSFVPAGYNLVHGIIYGAIQYAETFGYKPAKEFYLTESMLPNSSVTTEPAIVEFGFKGKPMIYVKKFEKPQVDIEHLNMFAGPGNFIIVYFEDLLKDLITGNMGASQGEMQNTAGITGKGEPENKEYIGVELPIGNCTGSFSNVDPSGTRIVNPRLLFMMCFVAVQEYLDKSENEMIEEILKETSEWKIRDEDEPEKSFSEEEKLKYDELTRIAESDPETASYLLMAAILKYPDNIGFYHLLEDCYQLMDEEELLNKLIVERFHRFPGDVRAVTVYLGCQVFAGNVDELEVSLDQRFDIHKQFPERESFTKFELMFFLLPVIYYYLEKGELLKVAAYFLILTFYDWPEQINDLVNRLYQSITFGLIDKFPPEVQDHFLDLLPDADE